MANTRLIAAAPEMLELLRYVDDYPSLFHYDDVFDYHKIRSLINRIEGRES